jgi:glycosyltransferase involved in cell wall biosynthesis
MWAPDSVRSPMSEAPKLSICVPSRNRQFCFQQTIKDLTGSARPDLEFVFADNSDDPSVMNGFMAGIDDRRIRYLPSGDRILSMMDNWERTVATATGEWICVIGDDDYIDPDIVDLIVTIEDRAKAVDAIAWNRAAFQWTDARSEMRSVTISLANRIVRTPRNAVMDRLFGWLGATHVPLCPYGIYHAAVHRDALQRVRTKFSGRCFEHPVVDYDFSHKLVTSADNFIYIDRPMSVLGVCAESNSAAVGNAKAFEVTKSAYLAENGDEFETATVANGFPFTVSTGVAGSIMAAQQWFKRKYGYGFEGWQGNFIRAVTNECKLWTDPDDYRRNVEICRMAFSLWENGKYAGHFNPVYAKPASDLSYLGVNRKNVSINQEIAGVGTPAELYAIIKQILPEFPDISVEL